MGAESAIRWVIYEEIAICICYIRNFLKGVFDLDAYSGRYLCWMAVVHFGDISQSIDPSGGKFAESKLFWVSFKFATVP